MLNKFKQKSRENIQVTTCTDVDECSEGGHSCHPSATCRNTLGGFVLFLVFSLFMNSPPFSKDL